MTAPDGREEAVMAAQRPDRRRDPRRWVPAAVLAVVLGGFAGWWAQPRVAEAPDGGRKVALAAQDRGDAVLDPATRERMVVPFGDRLWVPAKVGAPVRLPDEGMDAVGLTDTMRIYAPRGGGGGGKTPAGWQAGEVYLKVGPGQYWPLTPKTRTPPPEAVPAPARPVKPMPVPPPERGEP